MGLIDFTAGDVLTAAQCDTLARQGVLPFATSAARDSGLTAVGGAVEGMVVYLEDSNTIQTYNGATWDDIALAGEYLALTGGTMSGAITLPASDPTNANHATRKSYVDAIETALETYADSAVSTNESTRNAQFDLDATNPSVIAPSASGNVILRGGGTTGPRPIARRYDNTYVGDIYAMQAPVLTTSGGYQALTGSLAYITGTETNLGTMPRSGYIVISAMFDLVCSTAGTATGKIYYQVNGGTWLAVPGSSEAVWAGQNADRGTVANLGYLSVNGASSYKIRLYGKENSGAFAAEGNCSTLIQAFI